MDKNSRKHLAFKQGVILGGKLVEDHPEIAKLRRNRVTQYDIVDKLGLPELYDVSRDVARTGVRFSLIGYEGPLAESYEGLLDSEENIEIAKDNERRNGHSRGTLMLKGGIGIHARTHDQILIDARKSVIARGEVPWYIAGDEMANGEHCEVDEKIWAYNLSLLPKNRSSSGRRIRLTSITDQVNDQYHDGEPIRTPFAVNCAIRKYKKSLDNIDE